MKQAHFFTTTRMESLTLVLVLALSLSLLASVHCYKANSFDSLKKHIVDAQRLKQASPSPVNHHVNGYSPVYVAPQDGLKLADKIDALPGQPDGIQLDHYSGYVTVDSTTGRALFYYFVESPNSSSHPLVLWLNGGPGCSSLGGGALMGLGPFRVNQDGASLSHNEHAWSNIANILFLESPAGVGFSYSNTTSDYEKSGDERTAEDSYTFLVNWLERFPEYKTRDFFITGEHYAGYYVPQLAQLILRNNKITNQTVINLQGIAIGNALIDIPSQYAGVMDFLWTHALMSDEIHQGIVLNCNFSMEEKFSTACVNYILSADTGNINYDDLYAPLCNSSFSKTHPAPAFDPCSESFISSYLNSPDVQKSLHANVTGLPGPWESCSSFIGVDVWSDDKLSVLPTLKELMGTGISVWVYSGDTDHAVPVTATRYAINKLKTSVKTPWYPWYSQDEVGGYAVEYENLTFATIRGSGHLVPSYQPARGLDLFSSFLAGKLPPPAKLAS